MLKIQKIKRTVFSFLMICLLAFSLSAEGLTLEGVCKSLASHPNTTGSFTQTKTLQTNGRKLTSTGKFIFCPLGILWQTEKPFPSSLILTEDAMIQIAANGKKSVKRTLTVNSKKVLMAAGRFILLQRILPLHRL